MTITEGDTLGKIKGQADTGRPMAPPPSPAPAYRPDRSKGKNMKAIPGRDMITLLCEITGIESVSGIRSITINANCNDVAVMTIDRVVKDTEKAVYKADSKTGDEERYTVMVTRIKSNTDE